MGHTHRMIGALGAVALLFGTAACNDTGLTPGTAITPPPWPRPEDTPARVQAAGLRLLPTEGTVFHIHSLLKVYFNGQSVTVPANIGIATAGLSPLHTHDTTGLVHVESPEKQDFTLSQFFSEWGVPLTGAKAWSAGQPVADAGSLVFKDQTAVVVVYGTPPTPIPSTYTTTP